MPSEREKMEDWSLEQVADAMSNAEPGTTVHTRAGAEILRRQTVLQQQSAGAQEQAATATIATARFTRLNARYMLFSVIVVGCASVYNVFQSEGLAGHREKGRYQLVQLSDMRRDQFMVDTQTGRLWEVVCVKPGQNVGECDERKLDPVLYRKDLLAQPGDIAPLDMPMK